MKGENIHILEELPLAGGSLDGILNPTRGFITVSYTHLWQMALYDLKQKEAKVVFLEVRESNKRAQYLYEILGFEAFHTRSDYYNDPVEDAIEYRLEIEQR